MGRGFAWTRWIVVGVLVAALAIPAVAGARLIRVKGGGGHDTMLFEGDADRIRITVNGRRTSRRASSRDHFRINAGRGNDRVTTRHSRIDSRLRIELTIFLGPGADLVRNVGDRTRIFGHSGNDYIASSGSRVLVRGGSGNDRIDLTGGRRNSVSCGSGTDSVLAGPRDRVSADCERVRRRSGR